MLLMRKQILANGTQIKEANIFALLWVLYGYEVSFFRQPAVSSNQSQIGEGGTRGGNREVG